MTIQDMIIIRNSLIAIALIENRVRRKTAKLQGYLSSSYCKQDLSHRFVYVDKISEVLKRNDYHIESLSAKQILRIAIPIVITAIEDTQKEAA